MQNVKNMQQNLEQKNQTEELPTSAACMSFELPMAFNMAANPFASA
jgi:hypothetical protein